MSECSSKEFINVAGDQCIELCPVGSSPDSSDHPKCQCDEDLLLVDDGKQCETGKCESHTNNKLWDLVQRHPKPTISYQYDSISHFSDL